MDRHRRHEIDNALLDAMPMQQVLRPPVLHAGHHAEHVLHAESDSAPVVSFYLGHGYDEVRIEHSARQP
jgi:ribosomal protein S18 acetylase RimI-like enzyme